MRKLFHIPLSAEAILFSVLYFAGTIWAYGMLGR